MRIANSGWVTPVLVAIFCAGMLAVAYNHQRGNFHRLKGVVLNTPPPVAPPSPGPGGYAPLSITRASTMMRTYPEFLSATMLPGRGFEVLQITAAIPGHGEVNLLHSPDQTESKDLLTDTGADAYGAKGTSIGGAFLAPWAGVLSGPAGSEPGMLQAAWEGQRFQVPASSESGTRSVEGLLLDSVAATASTSEQSDSEIATALFHVGSAGHNWPAPVDVTTTVQMTGQAIDVTLTAVNTGNVPAPVGLGWKPIFNIVSGDRNRASITVPATMRLATDSHGMPTGRTEPVAGTDADFDATDGTPLNRRNVDATYVDLRPSLTATGPTVVFRDPGEDFGLRLTALNGTNAAVHVVAKAGEPWVSVEMDSNRDDALGRQWGTDASGMRTLQPGESMVWRMRLEIFELDHGGVAPGNAP